MATILTLHSQVVFPSRLWEFVFVAIASTNSKWLKWMLLSHSVVSDSLRPHELYSSWNFSSQNTGVGSLSLLQRIFPSQGLNPGLLHFMWILYQLSHKGSSRILEGVAYLFTSDSSRPRTRTRVSCIAGGFFTNWAIREALSNWRGHVLEAVLFYTVNSGKTALRSW